MSRLTDFLSRLVPNRNIPIEEIRQDATAPSGFDQPEQPDRSYFSAADQGYRNNELVFACINEYITSASEARLIVGTRDQDRNFIETTDSRALELLNEPNRSQDMTAFLEQMHMQLLIGGNAYMYKPTSDIGTLSGMWLLRPDRVRVIPDTMTGYPQGWYYTIDHKSTVIPEELISQHKVVDPLNDWYGLGALQVLAKMVNLDMSATDFAKSVFENKGVPAGFLKVARRLNTQDEADAIRRNWHARFAGKANWQRIGVLDEDASYEELASKMTDMAMPDLRNLTESRICAAFGVPPIVVGANVGLQNGTYSNYAQAKESFWEETLMPAYKRIAVFMTRALRNTIEFRNMEFSFDFSGVRALAEDREQEALVRKISSESAGILIRAGYTPESVTTALQLPQGLEHTGLVPVTLQGEELAEGTALMHAPIQNVKSMAELESATAREYDTSVDALESDIQKAFNKLGRDADSIIGRAIANDEAESEVVKAAPTFGISGETLIPIEFDAVLAQAIAPELRNVAENTWRDVTAAGVLSEVSFSSQEGLVRQQLNGATTRAKEVNAVTRQRINAQLQRGVNRGYSLRQIADGVPGENFNGLRNIVRGIPSNPDKINRARVIARTEVRWAQNQTTALRYKSSGVSEVIISDGDQFDEACAAVDGTRQTIDWYTDNPIEHPNCTRRATPVVEGLGA
jgi:HK97 family phage portal protein